MQGLQIRGGFIDLPNQRVDGRAEKRVDLTLAGAFGVERFQLLDRVVEHGLHDAGLVVALCDFVQ